MHFSLLLQHMLTAFQCIHWKCVPVLGLGLHFYPLVPHMLTAVSQVVVCCWMLLSRGACIVPLVYPPPLPALLPLSVCTACVRPAVSQVVCALSAVYHVEHAWRCQGDLSRGRPPPPLPSLSCCLLLHVLHWYFILLYVLHVYRLPCRYESLGNDGMGSMYRWFEAYQDEHFPDPMGLRAMAHKCVFFFEGAGALVVC